MAAASTHSSCSPNGSPAGIPLHLSNPLSSNREQRGNSAFIRDEASHRQPRVTMTSDHSQPIPSASTAATTSTVDATPRNIIICKDEKGFGLKVSGSQPVFVAYVAENGAAARAGVKVYDQIIKVNGTNVLKADHNEVVNLIRGGTGNFVQLTLTSQRDASSSSSVPMNPSALAASSSILTESSGPVAAASTSSSTLKTDTVSGTGRRSFLDPSRVFPFRSNQSKSSSALDAAKSSHEEIHPTSSSLSSLALSSSSSSDSEESNEDEEEYVSASSDPSTPILPSSEFKRKKRKKNKRSKSLQEGVVTTQLESSNNESKAKEFEQAEEEEEKERRLEREKRRRKLKQRKLKFSELISTEKSFGSKLRITKDRFHGEMKNNKVCSMEDLEVMFSNHIQLVMLQNLIYFKLRTKVKPLLKPKRSSIDWKAVGNQLEKIFQEYGPKLKEEFAIYCSNCNAATELLRSKIKKDTKFSAFLAAAENAPELDRLKLNDLLMAPVQRITKYPLLVNEVLSTFYVSSTSDPIESGKTDVKKDRFLKREQEARIAFESALSVIKDIVSGVNHKKTEFEFLSWFKQKVAPFYPRANSLTPKSIEVKYEGEVTWMINKKHHRGILLLLRDLILILTESTPSSTDKIPSSSGLSSSISSPSLAPVASSASTSPSTSNIPSSSSFSFSFLSSTVRSVEQSKEPGNHAGYVLKYPPTEGEKHSPQNHSPVLEVSVSLETRKNAVNRRAFYLFETGNSEPGSTGTGGKGGKDSSASSAAPAMYEFDAGTESGKECFMNEISKLVEAKKLERNGVSPIKHKLSGCTNPFLSGWSPDDEQLHRQSLIPRIHNRPLPPLPSSVSFSSFSDREAKAARMKRSKSQEGRTRRTLPEAPTFIGGGDGGNEYVLSPTSSSSSFRSQGFHPRQPSDSDLPPVVGRIERMPEREPLNNFADSVVVTNPPGVRYAQRITVTAPPPLSSLHHHQQHHYSNDHHRFYDGSEGYEEVRDDGYSSIEEARLNKQILKLLVQRKKLLQTKYSIPSNIQSSEGDSNPTNSFLYSDWINFSVDAFNLELLTLDEKEWESSGQKLESQSETNKRLHENDINELRLKMINVLTK